MCCALRLLRAIGNGQRRRSKWNFLAPSKPILLGRPYSPDAFSRTMNRAALDRIMAVPGSMVECRGSYACGSLSSRLCGIRAHADRMLVVPYTAVIRLLIRRKLSCFLCGRASRLALNGCRVAESPLALGVERDRLTRPSMAVILATNCWVRLYRLLAEVCFVSRNEPKVGDPTRFAPLSTKSMASYFQSTTGLMGHRRQRIHFLVP